MRVAVITTSRADWNALQPVVRELRAQGADARVIAIADHAGFEVLDRDVEMTDALGTETPANLGHRDAEFGAAVFTWLAEGGVDIVLLCGDRHETLAAAHAAVLAGIPIAHIAGGDVTEGSSDNKYRNAISALADMHFPTNAESEERLVRAGRGPNVYTYGSPAVDRIMRNPFMPRAELCKLLGLEDARPFVMANWQPETPKDGEGLDQMLVALAYSSTPGVFVGVNPDPGAIEAEEKIKKFIDANPGWRRVENLEPAVYLSALLHAECLIGNSSSGFYEAPYIGTPVINIGNRQKGRIVPKCVVQVDAVDGQIVKALQEATRAAPEQLYGDGTAAPKIAAAILTPLVR